MYNNQAPQQGKRPLDKGFIKVIIGQFVKKQNGQTVMQQGTNNPVMSNKYATIGEVTRWPGEQGGSYDNVEFYPGFTIMDMNKNGRIFWDSQVQQAPQQQGGFQQQAPSYQQQR